MVITRNTAISDFDLHYTIYIYTNGPLKSRSGSWLDINDEKILKINSMSSLFDLVFNTR